MKKLDNIDWILVAWFIGMGVAIFLTFVAFEQAKNRLEANKDLAIARGCHYIGATVIGRTPETALMACEDGIVRVLRK